MIIPLTNFKIRRIDNDNKFQHVLNWGVLLVDSELLFSSIPIVVKLM